MKRTGKVRAPLCLTTSIRIDMRFSVSYITKGWETVSINRLPSPSNYYGKFMRCHGQTGYGIHMTGALCSLQEDSAFEKLYFRHNEKLSADIYNLMDQGRKVYPQEGLNDF